MEKKDKGEVTRRDFIKCVAIGGAILSVSGAVPKSLYAADKDQDDDCEFYIIDAHAHPDKWRSSDDSDSLVDIKELG
ncbi:MAG: twin-arginine translocation signal domain-containing protein, partial [Deltaproteobacteria bacterium]|nr:twin-arginine translocation signal domain-containing protein [Deltaproteobacteria bacterium]